MIQRLNSHLRRTPREHARDSAGAARRLRAAAATRNVELERILSHAARRQLARLAGSTRRGAAPHAAARRPAGDDPATAPTLLARAMPTPDLLQLRLSRPVGFAYRPGQHVKMGVPGLLRTYSLVSAPHEDSLEFFVELFPGGRLSERLRGLPPGSAMALGERAKGHLTQDAGHRTQLLVATVTGIAPYVSFLRHHFHGAAGGRRFVVLHGASRVPELGYLAELSALMTRHPRELHYLPTISRPPAAGNAGWDGATGRVETHVEAVLTRFGLTPADTAAFACGNPGMVSNVARLLRARGFAVQTEPFD